MLKDALEKIAATTPPPGGKSILRFYNVGKANARITELESTLGVKHGQPIFNIGKANRRIEHLETLIAQQTAGASIPASTVASPIAAKADAGNLKATCMEFLKMSAADQIQFCRAGGQMSHSEFNTLPREARSAFSAAGGVLSDAKPTPPDNGTTALPNTQKPALVATVSSPVVKKISPIQVSTPSPAISTRKLEIVAGEFFAGDTMRLKELPESEKRHSIAVLFWKNRLTYPGCELDFARIDTTKNQRNISDAHFAGMNRISVSIQQELITAKLKTK